MEQPELTDEQLDAQIREDLAVSIELGKAFSKLRTSPEYKRIFDEVYLKNGLDVLWQNTRHLTEGQMIGRGSDKNQQTIDLINGQVKSRLDFKGFIDTIESDYESAVDTLAEMDAEGDTDA